MAGACLLLPSCVEVNDDYDLSEDIDMTIGVGGDLTLPTSNTVKMKMKDILDLEEDGIIRPMGEDSVYYLVEGADTPSSFAFDLPTIAVNDPSLSPFKLSFTVPALETLLSSFGLPQQTVDYVVANKGNVALLEALLGDEAHAQKESPAIELDRGFNVLNYDFTMPDEVMALKEISFSVPMQPDFDLTTDMPAGQLGLHGVFAEFPAILDHDNITFGGTWLGSLNEEGRHQYNLPKDVWLKQGEHTRLELEFVGIDLSSSPWEQTAGNRGVMTIAEDVAMHGTVTVRASIIDFLALAGETFTLTATISMKAPQIGNVTVVVDPEINPESTTIELNDLPDFLTDNDVTVVLQQPAIRLNVVAAETKTNEPLPVMVDCWGTLDTDKGISVGIGSEQEPGIRIGGVVNSDWCIWDGLKPAWGEAYDYFNAVGLTRIIETIPNRIDLGFDARVRQEYVTLALGTSYKATIGYNVECPLALAVGSKIIYTETVDDLHKDLEDFEVKALKITARLYVESPGTDGRVPFDKLDLTVKPLDLAGNPIAGIVVSPLVDANSGDLIEVNLTCEEGAMKALEALEFEVAAKVTEENAAPLSAKTTVQLTDVSVGIIGGVIADLN